MSDPSRSFDTRAIRGGGGWEPATPPILPPIYQSTTYVRNDPDLEPDYSYSRCENPTITALEGRLGALEGTPPACCFSTGMAAITTLLLAVLRHGDRVVASDVLYGGSFRLLREVFEAFAVESDFVDTSDLDAVGAALTRPTRLLLLESPANPTLKLTDLAACAQRAREVGALVAVDNTFLTPVLQEPLPLGAHVVVYSTTKYQEGHNAALGGALCTHDEDLLERLRFVRKSCGTIQSPFNGWLTLQGLKTLPLRIRRHCDNALLVARALTEHPRVRHVLYPGLPAHPQHELATRQQRAGGGLVAFEIDGGPAETRRFLKALRLCSLAENMGCVETLVTHPASMTHASIPAETRNAIGITDGLLRINVGIEDGDAIVEDLSQALEASGGER